MNRRAFFLGVLLFACAKTEDAVDPVWGKEPCAHCRMIVGEKRYAAQAGGDGDRRFFDDIGCLVAWVDENPGKAPKLWVRTEEGRWVDAKTAHYEAGAKTPMDFGFVVASSGVDWDEMSARVRAKKGGGR